jgi:hypothetical protein
MALAAGMTAGTAAAQALSSQAQQQSSQSSQSASRMRKVTKTATIQDIDRSSRTLTLKDDQGNTFTVDIPQKVKRFNALKQGDRVRVDYYESIALSLQKGGEGAQQGARETTRVQRNAGTLPGGIAMRRVTGTVQVLDVDKANNTVTVRGPKGRSSTIHVTDPQMQSRLANLKAGDRIHVAYNEAVAVKVTPQGQQGQQGQMQQGQQGQMQQGQQGQGQQGQMQGQPQGQQPSQEQQPQQQPGQM